MNLDIKKLAQLYPTNEVFTESLEQYEAEKNIKENTIVSATILGIVGDTVFLDLGLKSEGIIDISELKEGGISLNEVSEGSKLDVYLESFDGGRGKIVISRDRVNRERAWDRLKESFERDEEVDGKLIGRIKGGYTVDLVGAVAFLPGSQVDVRPIKDVSILVGLKQPFKILKMDEERGNIVVSRRAVLEIGYKKEVDEVLSSIHEGQTLEGVIKNITDYGAFVDLGKIDGLIHVTDISWSRINHPSEVLTLGDIVKVKVIKYDPDKKQVSLGLKQLEDNPWSNIAEKYKVGTVFEGTISNVADYGVFIELSKGIEGLVHVSEISWSKNMVSPKDTFEIGNKVKVSVIDLDIDKHRVSLSIKQCQDNPWQEFANNHEVGDKIKCTISNITDFGLFVGLDGGIDGLIHISDLDWMENPRKQIKKYNKGDEIEAILLNLDPPKERIGLGIKQLSADPFTKKLANITRDSIVTCKIVEIKEEGLEVDVNDVRGFIKKFDLAKDKVDQKVDRFAVGERVDAKVVNIDKNNRKLSLSIRKLEIDEHNKVIKEFGSGDSGASLGDILGVALDNNDAADTDAKEEEARDSSGTNKQKEKKVSAKAKENADSNTTAEQNEQAAAEDTDNS